MATIAGMISSPNRLNPLHHPQLAEQRRNEVLGLMLADGYISKAAYDSAATSRCIRARSSSRTTTRPTSSTTSSMNWPSAIRPRC